MLENRCFQGSLQLHYDRLFRDYLEMIGIIAKLNDLIVLIIMILCMRMSLI